MIVIIPLGGIGSRFKKNGYDRPKALINVFGKPIIFWLLDNLIIENNTTVYIPYNKEYLNFRFEDLIIKNYPNISFKFFMLKENTRGAAETLNIALKQLDCKDQPIISLDSDNFYTCDIIKMWNKKHNVVFTFKDETENPIFSYVLTNKNNEISKIIEKNKISDNACCGGYAFNSYKNLLKYTQHIIDNDIRDKDEFYTSTVIREMLSNKIKFFNIGIPKSNFTSLGTPLQLRYFYNNFPKKSCKTFKNNLKELRICFDLDNTLVTFPKVKNDYTSVEPIKKNIDFLRYLKNFNHTIIIYTARRMKTHKSNRGKVLADIGKITFDTLEKFNIPFDEIYFGKPQADFYIDDLAVDCFDNLEKKLGYYNDLIQPRSFNTLKNKSLNIFRKESNDLSGEIYYFKNIPMEIKDVFPIFIDYDINNKWYEIEQIDGLTSSVLYTSQILTKEMLISIMGTIKRLHNCKKNKSKINIYENYSSKLEKRFKEYDYSLFSNYDIVFNEINTFLLNYENEKKGKECVIHGDTVLTNILINSYDKIKLIDMRGKIGNKLTIKGDWLYDWAKLYQSLIGYDNILLNKEINNNYISTMINIFNEEFLKDHSKDDLKNLKVITKSLLFSLIPLHNNAKCYKFYDLIFSPYLM